jgi:soluble lytic murein transglycosylase
MKHRRTLPIAAAFTGLVGGLGLSAAWSETDLRDGIPTVSDLHPATALDPMRVITRTETMVAMERASRHLAEGRPWAAWLTLRGYVAHADAAEPDAVLLAARAAGGWGGWGEVRRLLEDRDWLGRYGQGEGWMLLGRGYEAAGRAKDAADAYHRYVAVARGTEQAVGYARLGGALRDAGDARAAAQAFGKAAAGLPESRDWLLALRADALARAGDPAAAQVRLAGASAPARILLARAAARVLAARGDSAGALARMEEESRAIEAQGEGSLAAPLLTDRARLLAALRRPAEARPLLARVAADAAAGRDDRLRAAEMLGALAGATTADAEMARAAAYEAGSKPGLAARALRGATKAGMGDDAMLRLRLGELLFDERDLGPARVALLDAASRLGDPEKAAEAELFAARALVKAGDRGEGLAALRRVVERHPGTAAAGSALYLLGDAAARVEDGIAYYRRAAAVSTSPYAPEALYRVGDRYVKNGNPAAAAQAWEQLVARWPRGEASARAAYLAGVLHERAGRDDQARTMYEAALAAEPVSYYAVRAADRLGVNPLDRVLAQQQPWAALETERGEGAAVLRRLDLLSTAGLPAEWDAELEAATRRLARKPLALLTVAEGLRDAGHTVDGIRLGRQLVQQRGGNWDGRLLRVVFPYPYREVLEDEARSAKVDPFFFAALVRQESSFDRAAKSHVGAMGLSQIMPGTGRWLTRGTGIEASDFDASMLAIPEVNLHMGARYLADQLRRYSGSRDLALIAYNAGPGRADRWRSELGHGGDPDAFREKIPFDETREYVKVVLRNAAIYRRLYGGPRSPGLPSE